MAGARTLLGMRINLLAAALAAVIAFALACGDDGDADPKTETRLPQPLALCDHGCQWLWLDGRGVLSRMEPAIGYKPGECEAPALRLEPGARLLDRCDGNVRGCYIQHADGTETPITAIVRCVIAPGSDASAL